MTKGYASLLLGMSMLGLCGCGATITGPNGQQYQVQVQQHPANTFVQRSPTVAHPIRPIVQTVLHLPKPVILAQTSRSGMPQLLNAGIYVNCTVQNQGYPGPINVMAQINLQDGHAWSSKRTVIFAAGQVAVVGFTFLQPDLGEILHPWQYLCAARVP